jgi:hypothetical protein
VILPNCLREFSKAKHLAFPGREFRYLKLLAGRSAWRMNYLGDMEYHRSLISGPVGHIIHAETRASWAGK